MKRRHPNYDHRLSRALLLVDGRRLITLRAASIVMSEVVGLSKPSSGALDYAIELLFTAAKSGSTSDIAAATDEIERLLRDQRLLAESRAELVVDV